MGSITQVSKEQAIALSECRFWEKMSLYDRAKFQLFQDLLCMPFDVFHEAIESALGRSVWTHEFAFRGDLIKEFNKEKPTPTFEDIINLIPKDKLNLVGL